MYRPINTNNRLALKSNVLKSGWSAGGHEALLLFHALKSFHAISHEKGTKGG